MNTITPKPKLRYWLISIIAFIWNSIGILAYLGQAYISDDDLKLLPEANQLYYSNMPAWVTSAFAVAVFGGFFGAIGLLFRKKWAYFLFVLSLIALIIQQGYNFFIQDYIAMTGPQLMLPVMTVVIAIYLVYFSNQKYKQGFFY